MIPLQEWHPMVVHFPIVLLILLAVTDVGLFASGRGLLDGGGASSLSTALAALAGLAAVITFFLGDMAADMAMESGVAESLIETHETLGTVTAVVAGLWALARFGLWWRARPGGAGLRTGVVGVEVVLAALVIATAYFGGDLVYHHGIAVVQSGA